MFDQHQTFYIILDMAFNLILNCYFDLWGGVGVFGGGWGVWGVRVGVT